MKPINEARGYCYYKAQSTKDTQKAGPGSAEK